MNSCYILCNGCQKWFHKMMQPFNGLQNKDKAQKKIIQCVKSQTDKTWKDKQSLQNNSSLSQRKTPTPIPRPTLKSIHIYHV